MPFIILRWIQIMIMSNLSPLFRFAANALFGSGIGGKTQQQNKMVSYYLEHISPYR